MKTMKNNTFNAEEPVRKSVYIFIALAGFFCLAVSAQFMGSDEPRVQENDKAKRTLNTQPMASDRFTRFKVKAASTRSEREIKKLIDQAEKAQSITLIRQTSDPQIASTGKCWIEPKQVPSTFVSEPNSHKIQ